MNLIFKPILELSQKIITRLDSQAWRFLKLHIDKTVEIDIKYFPILNLKIVNEGFEVCDKTEHPDVSFSGTLSAFHAFLKKEQTSGALHVKGDVECAKAIHDTWEKLDLDWESLLAQLMGTPLAHTACKAFFEFKNNAAQVKEARLQDIGSYLQEEINVLPTSLEMNEFLQEVDVIRLDVERLEAKLLKLGLVLP